MSDMEARQEDEPPFVLVDDPAAVRELLNLTMRGESVKLDELVEKGLKRFTEVQSDYPRSAHMFYKELEHWMRRAFKLAVDTEVEAMAELYDKMMSGMQTKHREAMVELDQAFTRSRTWVKVQPPSDAFKHQVPPV